MFLLARVRGPTLGQGLQALKREGPDGKHKGREISRLYNTRKLSRSYFALSCFLTSTLRSNRAYIYLYRSGGRNVV